jgi:hypothetical protein
VTNPVSIGPWSQGLWNTTKPVAVPNEGMTEAMNVDIDRSGSVTRRQGWALLDATPAHSLFEFAGRTMGVVGGTLGYLDTDSFTSLAPVAGRLSWTVLNGEPVFCSQDQIGLVRGETVVELPSTIQDDEAELMLTPMPGGSWIAYWSGRLVVARGNSLIFSEPLRYGVTDSLRGFIQFEERVSWIAPLDTGLYVGLRNSVRWLAGTNPMDLTQKHVGGPSWRGAAAVLGNEHLDPELRSDHAAVWMTSSGFVLGLPTGDVILPQAARLQDIALGNGRLVVQGDRVTVLSNHQ